MLENGALGGGRGASNLFILDSSSKGNERSTVTFKKYRTVILSLIRARRNSNCLTSVCCGPSIKQGAQTT
jgi:hypothetical protein